MADNISEVLKNLISGMDKNALGRAIPEFRKIISTPEGQKLAEKIRASDKETLSRLLSELKRSSNPEEALRKISQNRDALKNLTDLFEKEAKK